MTMTTAQRLDRLEKMIEALVAAKLPVEESAKPTEPKTTKSSRSAKPKHLGTFGSAKELKAQHPATKSLLGSTARLDSVKLGKSFDYVVAESAQGAFYWKGSEA